MKEIQDLIADVPDFPKPGIVFKDITTLLERPERSCTGGGRLQTTLRRPGYYSFCWDRKPRIHFCVSPRTRHGRRHGVDPKARQASKSHSQRFYALEYGEDTVQIHQDAVGEGDKVVIVDDLIATGGTARAAADFVLRCGAEVHEIAAVIELSFLPGREKLGDIAAHALVAY